MLRRLRATAPVALVPLAWGFAAAAHLGLLSTHAVFVGHIVMGLLLIAFALLSGGEMRSDPVLRNWLTVVVAGIPVTLAGAYGVRTGSILLTRLTVFGWMLLPAAALVPTARVRGLSTRAYGAAAALSFAGGALFLVAGLTGGALPLLAITVVGIGQTLAIVTAVREN